LGTDAFISYFPFDQIFSTQKTYLHYDTPQKKIIDSREVLIIFPETATHQIPDLDYSQIGIWWLSLNSYLGKIHSSRIKNLLEDIYWRMKGKKNLRQMKPYLHFSQSQYAKVFLEDQGIRAQMLTDYLGKSHMSLESEHSERLDQIAYNPKKGFNKTERLIRRNPDISFVPIQGMSPEDVHRLLKRSKVYIDFGIHPGKDRFPREAAMAGCCIITGQQGSAANPVDIPIPRKYKLDDSSDIFMGKFRPLVDEIFSNFYSCSREFNEYRTIISGEPDVFKEQVKRIFIEPTPETR
jgi:hypothetical protein